MKEIENVILVNEHDEQIGMMEKMEAHIKGKLHRAFSIFIFNSKGELLLQQRALEKYHSGGKWTNTCCSHPRPGEQTIDAAYRRLQEEMGIKCTLNPVFHFTYCSKVETEIFEYEFDHVFFGQSDRLPQLNLKEAMDYRYIMLSKLQYELTAHPENYSEWLKICCSRISEAFAELIGTNLGNVSCDAAK